MYIAETNSTNSHICQLAAEHSDSFLWLRTDYQTQGRGQQGNSWESERGKNLLFSLFVRRPDVPIAESFTLSMRISLALVYTLLPIVPETKQISIKWPNDIYYGQRKLAGILIENALCGHQLEHSVIGVGLNVNQTLFVSDAPNPISLALITGRSWDLDAVLNGIIGEFQRLSTLPLSELKSQYMSFLFHKDGFYPYVERVVDNLPSMPLMQRPKDEQIVELCIRDVTEQGELVVVNRQGEQKQYHFKQIKFIIEQ